MGSLIEELAGPWAARQESRRRERQGGRDRLRAKGGGPSHRLPFTDRVIATLVIMRFQLPHVAPPAGPARPGPARQLLTRRAGVAETAWFRYLNAPLETCFTAVYWDQRGPSDPPITG